MTKKEIRTFYKQKRMTLSPSELEKRSESIVDLLFSNFQLEGKTISLFLPIERHKEINTYYILEKGISIGATIGLPKTNSENHSMKHFQYESHTQLAVNELGIPEPTVGKVIPASQFDYVFVPLLAIDSNGHRIGYGKGYYDRFLKKCSPHCKFIGLNIFDEFVEIDDIDSHDMELHYCISPSNFVRFDNN